uniref:Col_cuticle_N domain-containing protein n=1 Tax=Globodera pallida TaxID=36090 RepID=A0A183C2P8_GLOPA
MMEKLPRKCLRAAAIFAGTSLCTLLIGILLMVNDMANLQHELSQKSQLYVQMSNNMWSLVMEQNKIIRTEKANIRQRRQYGFSAGGDVFAFSPACQQGPKGSQGYPGEPGQDGEPGRPGSLGISSVVVGGDAFGAGSTCRPCPTGPPGPPGYKGKRGIRGEKGPQGVEGEEGPEGEIGLSGETGEAGERGPPGADGVGYAKGAPGSRGESGPAGETGAPAEYCPCPERSNGQPPIKIAHSTGEHPAAAEPFATVIGGQRQNAYSKLAHAAALRRTRH